MKGSVIELFIGRAKNPRRCKGSKVIVYINFTER